MFRITKSEREELERVGLLRHRKVGANPVDANFTIVNREHMSRDKACYVVEEEPIKLFLGRYDGLNLQNVSERQVKELKNKGLITEDQIQHWTEYKPAAVAFQDIEGHWHMRKITKLMLELGIWKQNKKF